MDFINLFQVLWKRKWWIVLTGIIGAISAFFFTANLQPSYQSNAQIATGFTINENNDDPSKSSQYATSVRFVNAIEALKSPNVLDLLSYDLVLHDLAASAGKKPFRSLAQQPSLKEVPLSTEKFVAYIADKRAKYQPLDLNTALDNRINSFLKTVGYDKETIVKMSTISRVLTSDFININVKTENPELSAFIANKIVGNYIEFSNSLKNERSSESVKLLDSLVREKKRALEIKEGALNNFKTSLGLLNSNVQGNSTVDMIRGFETEKLSEQANLRRLKLSLEDANSRIKAFENDGNAGLNSRIVILRNKINDLQSQYDRSSPKDEAIFKQLQSAKTDYEIEIGKITESGKGSGMTRQQLEERKYQLQVDISSSEQKIAALDVKIAQLKGDTRSIAASYATEETLQKEVSVAEEDYNSVVARFQAAQAKSNIYVNELKQSIIAQPAWSPLPSKRWAIVAVSGVGLMALLSGILIILQFFDSSIKSPTSFENQVGLRMSGIINMADLQGNDIYSLVNKSTVPGPTGRNRNNLFREALRKLRYEIETSGKKIILFTSTEPGQGKTTLIQALAYSFSLSNRKVLVIDTNFCNNDLTVQLAAKPVLEDINFDNSQFTLQKIDDLVTHGESGVDVIGCKGGDYTPNEILPRENLLKFLPQLKNQYDYIFIEGAPLNGFTDTKELEPFVEGIVAVFSATSTFTSQDKTSTQFMKSQKDKFIGAVLNKVEEQDQKA